MSLRFLNPQEAQRWAALVQGAAMEGQNGSGSPPPAQSPGTCPVSPPSPPVALAPKAPNPRRIRPGALET